MCNLQWIENNTWTDSVQTHIEIALFGDFEGPVLISNVSVAGNIWVNSSWWRGASTGESWHPPCALAFAGTSDIRCGNTSQQAG